MAFFCNPEIHFLLSKEIGSVMDFNCQRCGRCCKEIGIPWTGLDPHLVSDYLNMDLHDFLDSYGYTVNEYTGEIEHAELGVTPCPFLKWDMEKAVCKIYPVRPWICKGYPGPGTRCRNDQKGYD
jgi:Fe-S-cluster containining protein